MTFGRPFRHTCLQTLVTKNTTSHAHVSVNPKRYHPSPRVTPGQILKGCQSPALLENFLAKPQGAGLPWDP